MLLKIKISQPLTHVDTLSLIPKEPNGNPGLPLIQLQENGIASPSSTLLEGRYAIRVCIVNQRTQKADLELLVQATLLIGNQQLSTALATKNTLQI